MGVVSVCMSSFDAGRDWKSMRSELNIAACGYIFVFRLVFLITRCLFISTPPYFFVWLPLPRYICEREGGRGARLEDSLANQRLCPFPSRPAREILRHQMVMVLTAS